MRENAYDAHLDGLKGGEYPELAHREEAIAREVLEDIPLAHPATFRLVLPVTEDPRRRPLMGFAAQAQRLTRFYTFKAPDYVIQQELDLLEGSIAELRAAL